MNETRVKARGFARAWASVPAVVLFAALATVGVHAQTATAGQAQKLPAAAQATAGGQPSAAGQGQASGQASGETSDASADPEDEGQYLHSPMVKTIARLMHLSLPAADAIFLTLNFLILALGIGVPLGRFLPKLLLRRRQELGRSLEGARKMTADADARLNAVEAQMAKLDQEIAAMRGSMEDELKREEARARAAMAEESSRIVAGAEQEIAAAAAHARRGLRQFAADLAIEQAAKQMVLTAEKDKALIAEFVRETANQAEGGRK